MYYTTRFLDSGIVTISQTATNALFDLAIRPEYLEPLRAEIEEVVAAHGWTKEAMGRMLKLDSFMKESSRLAGISVCESSNPHKRFFRALTTHCIRL